MATYLQVLTTVKGYRKGTKLAWSITGARLAACVQVVGPIQSVYRWEGRVKQVEEWQLLIKTTAEAFPALEEHIKANHPYDTPEIIATPIAAGSAEYLAWIGKETKRYDAPS
ncbi:divalent-cation tolerance protein CutA [Planomonospora venezuelensis]|uniref:Periplasmic divalent cation tolerance protein n=1 Tax=Planomonospora venezuelensis TaxID=1999 RepID=A0A841D725_PLAVE|nr:divalent-cation tolerance protein CutA [Planomonospora venezuelensis]MBB5965279.1 periplasmic divalent cation tolerance protein [Planomonospora venezuelensis]GIN00487.1 divalent cation tolerance protein [Planomonospora venezuelensis]